MRAEVSCLFHLENHPHVVKQAQIGGGVHLQEIIPPNDWFDKVLASQPSHGADDSAFLLRARQELNGVPYTHRLYISLDEVTHADDPLVGQAQQMIIRAIILSRIIEPTPIASGGPWILSLNPDSDDADHRPMGLAVGFYGTAYVSRPLHEQTLTNSDAARMAALWVPLQRLFTHEEKYRRILRALKFFDGAYHMGIKEFKHIIFHAALESLICVSRDLNKKQITQRLPLLVPEITEEQASAIYELCCEYKHAAAPLQLMPPVFDALSPIDQQRYKATEWLEQALRFLLQKALSDAAFADLLADRGELAHRFPVSSRKKKSSIGDLIVRESNIRGGRPIIAGTGVTVRRIVGWYKLGLRPEEIADRVGHLSLSQVYAALTYYHANKDELETDIAAEEAEADRLERDHYLSLQGRS
jgi:uncharacterized protein (DUF433 family)